MNHTMRAALIVAACAAALTAPALTPNAHADIPAIDVGVGALGFFGGNFLTEPDDKSPEDSNFEVPYPGFGGTGAGGGLILEARALGIVGLETGLYFGTQEATGDIDDVDITLRQRSLHIPLLLKLALPGALVSPNIFGGLEFVIPQESEAEQEVTALVDGVTGKGDPYKNITFGVGIEFKLPIPGIDLRIPFSIRGTRNLDDDGSIDSRVQYTTQGRLLRSGEFSTEWSWQTTATLGLAYYFL